MKAGTVRTHKGNRAFSALILSLGLIAGLVATATPAAAATTVTWNDLGTTSTDSRTYNQPFGTLPAPVRDSFTLVGWTPYATSGTPITTSTLVPVSNTTYYAKWNAGPITWDNQGATTSFSTGAAANFAGWPVATVQTAPTKTGYTFAGWFTALTGGTQVTGGTYTPPSPYGPVTFYARWTANTLAVTYNTQGGSAISNGSTTTGGQLTLPVSPTRNGYTFNGWFTAATGGSAITFPYTHARTSNFTLYAQWVPNTITWNSNISPEPFEDSDGEIYFPSDAGYPGATTYVSGSAIAKVSGSVIAILPLDPWRDFYNFDGWWTTASSGGSRVTDTYVPPSPYGPVTFYARWKPQEWNIAWDNNDADIGRSDDGSTTYFGGGSPVATIPTTAPQKGGFTFGGWFTDRTGGTEVTNGSYTPLPLLYDGIHKRYTNVTFFAHWTANPINTSSTDATLSLLTFIGGPLSPAFTSGTTNYTGTVVNALSQTTVTPYATAGSKASVKVNGITVASGSASGAIPLEVGRNNVIQIVVTAEDGTTTKTYTITLTRTINDATLSALNLSSGELSPTFTSGTTNYTASVSNPTITITPTVNQVDATTVQYLGADGTTPFTGALNVGANVIRTVVTALNGSTTKTYTVTVTRRAADVAPQVNTPSPTPPQAPRTDVQVVKPVPVTPIPAPKVPATSPAPIPANSTLMKALSGNKNVKVTVTDLTKLGVIGVKQSNLPTVLQLLKGVDQTKLDVPTINKTVKAADAAIKKAEVAKTSKK